jgi:serine/threonine-protein kinase
MPTHIAKALPHGETLAGQAQGTAVDRTINRSRNTVLPTVAEVDGQARLVHDERPRYAEVSPLGAGGMGEVTLVHDQDIGRKVALKRLHSNSDSSSLARFAEEVRIVGRLEHPNIVPIHDVGIDERGQHFFVMKYVDGETLEKIITRLAAGDPAYVSRYTHAHRLQIAIELLRALQHAHENGIIHRDLKPANIMVGRYGEVMLMDWGLAKPVSRKDTIVTPPSANDTVVEAHTSSPRAHATEHGAVLGTPAYMSPEQAAGKHDTLDERSDVYAVGIVLYELFSLVHPRDAKSLYELLHVVANEPLSGSRTFGAFTKAGAPAAVGHAIMVACAHDPNKRFASAAEMSARLADIRDGAMPIQCHITFIARMSAFAVRQTQRHPLLALLLLLALPLLTFFGLWQAVRLL